MSTEQLKPLDPQVKLALDELEKMVLDRYPEARFQVERGEDDPEGIHLITTVDTDDPDQVLDVVIDRVLHYQVEEHLPVHVIPIRPISRVLDELQRPRPRRRPRIDLEGLAPPA